MHNYMNTLWEHGILSSIDNAGHNNIYDASDASKLKGPNPYQSVQGSANERVAFQENKSAQETNDRETSKKCLVWRRICSKIRKPAPPVTSFAVLKPTSSFELDSELKEKGQEELGRDALRDALKAYDRNDFESARHFYEIAASNGELLALHNLGVMLLYGQGILPDSDRAHKCFITCASHGLAESMAELGYMHFYGHGVTRDFMKSRSWFLRSLEIGDVPFAEYSLALIYLKGLGTAVNVELAGEYLISSARKQFAPAVYNLAVFYAEGKYNFPNSPETARKLYKQIALYDNNAAAQNNLGVLCAKGVTGHRPNPEYAVTLFRMAANQDISQAMFNLGEAYSTGIGVSSDITQAAKYYYQAAKSENNSEADYALGNIFLHGRGNRIKPNQAVALYWFEKAAKHGHRAARNNLLILRKQTELTRANSLNKLAQQKLHARHIY